MTVAEQFYSLKKNGYVQDSEPGDIHHWDSDDKDHRKQPDGSWPVVGSKEDKVEKEEPKVDDKGYPFEKTSEGSVNFGEVTKEMASAMGTNVAAPIRYSSGNYDYGKKHLEENHLKDIEAYGYDNSNDFVEDVAQNFDEIYQGNQEKDKAGNVIRNTFILTIHKTNMILYIELKKSNDEDYYSVGSGGIVSTRRYSKTKENRKIWNRPTTDSQVADTLAGVHACPLYIRNMASKAAVPTNLRNNIPHDSTEVKTIGDLWHAVKQGNHL